MKMRAIISHLQSGTHMRRQPAEGSTASCAMSLF